MTPRLGWHVCWVNPRGTPQMARRVYDCMIYRNSSSRRPRCMSRLVGRAILRKVRRQIDPIFTTSFRDFLLWATCIASGIARLSVSICHRRFEPYGVWAAAAGCDAEWERVYYHEAVKRSPNVRGASKGETALRYDMLDSWTLAPCTFRP